MKLTYHQEFIRKVPTLYLTDEDPSSVAKIAVLFRIVGFIPGICRMYLFASSTSGEVGVMANTGNGSVELSRRTGRREIGYPEPVGRH